MTLQDLFNKYSLIFDPIYQLSWELPDSWILLVDKLCSDIQAFHQRNPQIPQVHCTQMKEKFGALRFYTDHAHPIIYAFIDQAAKDSMLLCQHCGCTNCPVSPTEGWITYLCPPCKAQDELYYEQLHV